MKLELSKLKSW